jgi:hypothetical protein
MQKITSILLLLTLLTACNNQPTPAKTETPTKESSAILKHKYWVSKDFYDALFASNVVDTMAYLPCSELVFDGTDTLLITACLSDAGRGLFKVTGVNTLEVMLEGFEGKPASMELDEKTGILRLTMPEGSGEGWPSAFVAQDDINTQNIDNLTIQLGRKRLAGKYTKLPKKGEKPTTTEYELRADGTHTGFGDFDTFEPWPSGVGGAFLAEPAMNIMYLNRPGTEEMPAVYGWQVRGDTLRLWSTKNIGVEGDLPEYRTTGLLGNFIKMK